MDNFNPVHEECVDPLACEIVYGKVPDIFKNHKYIRNGPNAIWNPIENWLDGNGMIHCVTFDTLGNPQYQSRFVDTPLYKAENATKSAIFPSLSTLTGGNLFRILFQYLHFIILSLWFKIRYVSKANTSIIDDGTRLLALAENGCPFSVDKVTLDTLGEETFCGTWSLYRNGWDGFTAHPKRCLRTGKLYVFGYDLFNCPHLRYSIIEPDGTVLLSRFGLPLPEKPVIIHDFAITENYVVIAAHPLIFSILNAFIPGRKCLEFQPNLPCQWLIFPKTLPNTIKVFKTPAAGILHIAHAYETEQDVIKVYAGKTATIDFTDLSQNRGSYLHLWKFNLTSTEWSEEKCSLPFAIEFPVTGKSKDWIYFSIMGDEEYSLKTRGLVAYSTQNDTYKTLFYDDCIYGGEASLTSTGSHLCTFVHDEVCNQSYLYIICAEDLSVECKIVLPKRVPYGIHGCIIKC